LTTLKKRANIKLKKDIYITKKYVNNFSSKLVVFFYSSMTKNLAINTKEFSFF